MKLYLIRHGETDYNKMKRNQGQIDIPLNEYGRELAEKTREGLAEVPFDLCLCSPLSRARETAEIILENDVQKSLKNKELQEVEKNALSKYFAYIDLNHVADYCYIDNKRNVYAKSYSQICYSDFQSSGLREKMGDEYAKTQWIWTRD